MISAPFTSQQAHLLNLYQLGLNSPFGGHPFTCPNRSVNHGSEGGDVGVLIATESGWVCTHCEYTQDWAHESMLVKNEIDLETESTLSFLTRVLDSSDRRARVRFDEYSMLFSRLKKGNSPNKESQIDAVRNMGLSLAQFLLE